MVFLGLIKYLQIILINLNYVQTELHKTQNKRTSNVNVLCIVTTNSQNLSRRYKSSYEKIAYQYLWLE